MLTAVGFVTAPDPVGVTLTMYVRDNRELCELVAPQAIRKPASEIASAANKTAHARLRRTPNGRPSSTAQNTTALRPFHGVAGPWFAALA